MLNKILKKATDIYTELRGSSVNFKYSSRNVCWMLTSKWVMSRRWNNLHSASSFVFVISITNTWCTMFSQRIKILNDTNCFNWQQYHWQNSWVSICSSLNNIHQIHQSFKVCRTSESFTMKIRSVLHKSCHSRLSELGQKLSFQSKFIG